MREKQETQIVFKKTFPIKNKEMFIKVLKAKTRKS